MIGLDKYDDLATHVIDDIEARIHARNRLAASMVVELCEQEGFGFVMHIAADEWRKREPEGAHAAGPCVVFTKKCRCKQRGGCNKCYGCGWIFKKNGVSRRVLGE